ncbi:hypothetical protein V6O07_12135 [Arthrospira platensis SPKY2]
MNKTVNRPIDITGLSYEKYFRETYEYMKFVDIMSGEEFYYMVDRRLYKYAGPFKFANKYIIKENKSIIVRNNFWSIGKWMEGLDKKYIFEL